MHPTNMLKLHGVGEAEEYGFSGYAVVE